MVWQKGQSGNPAGRARRGQTLVEALRGALTAKARKAIAERAIAMAEEGQMEAIKFIFERIDGKVTQRIDMSIVRTEAERLAKEYGLDVNDVLEEATTILEEKRT